jgi:polyribonucleotide nucleotidyltransferase
VAYIDGQYVLNPGKTQLKTRKWTWSWPVPARYCFDGRVEASQLSEEIVLGAIVYGRGATSPSTPSTNSMRDAERKPSGLGKAPARTKH